MLKIGLTGGIGSGKTTVSDLFAKKNIPIIDADKISHQLTQPGEAGFTAIIKKFGNKILDQNNTINRAMLRGIIFNSVAQKQALEAILHPLVYSTIETRITTLRAHYCILSVPLLLETSQQKRVDRILVIDCPESVQIARVEARDNLEKNQIQRIIDYQSPRQVRLEAADDVIRNNSDHSQLDLQVKKLHNFYHQLSLNTGSVH